jgi:hypothetical protein
LQRIAGAHKTEWDLGVRRLIKGIVPDGVQIPDIEVFRGMNYTFIRDVGDGRPAHVWIPGMSYVPPDHIEAAAAGQIVFGNIANLDMGETYTPDEDFIPALELGQKVTQVMQKSRPVRWMLIHYNEAAQEHYLPDVSKAWKHNIYPMYGAYDVAQSLKLPVGFITDSQLLQGMFQDAAVLFLPNAEFLAPGLQSRINEFEANGGIVISQEPDWNWYLDGSSYEEAFYSLTDKLQNISTPPSIHSEGGNTFYHAKYYYKMTEDTSQIIAAYSNDLGWIVSNSDEALAQEELAASIPPENVKDITLMIKDLPLPLSVKEVVSGQELNFSFNENTLIIQVPEFQFNAIVEISYVAEDTTEVRQNIFSKPLKNFFFDDRNKRVVLTDPGYYDSYHIYTAMGQETSSGKIPGNYIDMNSLATGVYFLILTNNENKQVRHEKILCVN